MSILTQGNLSINGTVIAYEGNVKITKGTPTRKANPQVNGQIIYVNDISSNFSTIKVTVRNNSENNDTFDSFFNNGDNNTITFNDLNFSKCTLEMIPEREDTGTTEYTFFGNPQI